MKKEKYSIISQNINNLRHVMAYHLAIRGLDYSIEDGNEHDIKNSETFRDSIIDWFVKFANSSEA